MGMKAAKIIIVAVVVSFFYKVRAISDVCTRFCLAEYILWIVELNDNFLWLLNTEMGQLPGYVNTLRPRQNGRHFADDIFKCIFLNENVWIPIEISLKFVSKGSINNDAALFQIMAWRRPVDKQLSEPMTVSSQTHICVTRPQWVLDKSAVHTVVYKAINGIWRQMVFHDMAGE